MKFRTGIFSFLVVASLWKYSREGTFSCLSQIYCQGGLLDRIQRSGVHPDSKTFVDRPTLKAEAEVNEPLQLSGYNHLKVLANFNELPLNASLSDIHRFVDDHFGSPGSELDYPDPVDWKESISLFGGINDHTLRNWAMEDVHPKWKFLIRQFNASRLCVGCVSSHLKLEHPFVVPGGRFREFYYWDSFWIIQGLLASEMYKTARGMILNFLSIVDQFGYIPNGSRIYYINRSQPPVLAQMIKVYVEGTGNYTLLREALPLLDREYIFWMNYRYVGVEDPACSSGPCSKLLLNVFNAGTDGPRPESHVEDVHLGKEMPTQEMRERFYKNIATAAESGWDFSSRWLDSKRQSDARYKYSGRPNDMHESPQPEELTSIDIVNLIPLDLNALMYSNERTLASFHDYIHHNDPASKETPKIMSSYYRNKAKERYSSMKKLLWSERFQTWSDYNVTSGKLRCEANWDGSGNSANASNCSAPKFYISDLSPIWFFEDNELEGVAPSENVPASDRSIEDEIASKNSQLLEGIVAKLVSANGDLKKDDVGSLWSYPGGIPTSEVISGQQWDFPNAWAPFQDYLVEALMKKSERLEGESRDRYKRAALEIGQRWIRSTYCGWKRTGHFFEKYNVIYPGLPGDGGEYVVQEGFGWTNSVILKMLKKFGPLLTLPSDCSIVPDDKHATSMQAKMRRAEDQLKIPVSPYAALSTRNTAQLEELKGIIQRVQ